jgi:hypothetical protein
MKDRYLVAALFAVCAVAIGVDARSGRSWRWLSVETSCDQP